MKTNLDKYHPLVNSDKKTKNKKIKNKKQTKKGKQTNCLMKVCNETITNGKYEKLLGIKVDHDLNFNEYVTLGKKTSKKISYSFYNCFSMDIQPRKINYEFFSHPIFHTLQQSGCSIAANLIKE